MTRTLSQDLAAAGLAFLDDRLDRRDDARANPEQIAAWRRDATARTLLFVQGKPLTQAQGDRLRAVFASPTECDSLESEEEIFLGLDQTGALFARALKDEPGPALEAIAPGAELQEMWRQLHLFDAAEVSQLGVARGLLAWHARHRFCANCGAASEVAHGGWRRRCPSCEAEHYPRVDPVSIMLIVHDDRILLGRSPNFPPGWMSCLAGFAEPGETPEMATRREAFEEAGVRLGAVRYITSQPWPFPSSLMLGMRAEALSDETQVDGVEIEAVRWFTRDEARALISGAHPDARIPPPFSIAHQLIRLWAEGG